MEYNVMMQDFLNIIEQIGIKSLEQYSYNNWNKWSVEFGYDIIYKAGLLIAFQEHLTIKIRNLGMVLVKLCKDYVK